jgi:hypothetical protein
VPTPATDTTEMFAVHDAFRAEFGALPSLITAVPEGDLERAGVVGGHVMMMTMMLHSHHGSEDLLLWPVLEERVPERLALVQHMEDQHQQMGALIEAAQAQAGEWMQSGSTSTAQALAVTMTDLDVLMVDHLAAEESQIMPIVSEVFTQEQFAQIGEHSRAHVPPDLLPIGLGIILSDTTPERGEAILEFMPPEARAGFEQFGRPMYDQYRARLVGAA